MKEMNKKWILKEESVLSCLKIYFEAHSFIKRNNFSKYFLISGSIFLSLFSVSIGLVLDSVDDYELLVTEKYASFIQERLKLDTSVINNSIQVSFWVIKVLIENDKDTLFSFIFLIIGSPFFSFISTKTEEINDGRICPFNIRKFFKELIRGLSLSIRNTLKLLGILIVITIIGLIPIIGILTPLFSFIIQAYFNGILITDYSLEIKGKSIQESERFYRNNKPEMFAMGLGFMFLLLIPVIGWFIAPIYGIVASNIFYNKRL